MLRPTLAVLVLLAAGFAGCVSSELPTPAEAPALLPEVGNLTFLEPVMVDMGRIASEPSISVAADGTIFVAAPTGVIKYATRPQDAIQHLDKGIFQGAIWRSTDNGSSFEHLAGLGPTPYHTAQPGGGDSDIAIDADGRIYVTDQFGLFTESVQYSDDNGDTWQGATPASREAPVDRQWLTADPEQPGHVYLHYNQQTNGLTVAETKDGGETWTAKAVTSIVAPPGRGVALPGGFYGFAVRANGITLVHTTDGGATWKDLSLPVEVGEVEDFFPSAFADTAGTLYVSWMEGAPNGTALVYTFSKDRGATWSEKRVAFEQPGYGTFSWGLAGDAGRLAFAWYGAPDPDAEWYLETGIVTGADTDAPQALQARADPDPIRIGRPCQSGSTCTSGRELGDFFEATVGPDGKLLVSYVRVLSPEAGGRVMVVRQDGGEPLFTGELPTPWVV